MQISKGLIKEIEFFIEDATSKDAVSSLADAKNLLNQILEEVKNNG